MRVAQVAAALQDVGLGRHERSHERKAVGCPLCGRVWEWALFSLARPAPGPRSPWSPPLEPLFPLGTEFGYVCALTYVVPPYRDYIDSMENSRPEPASMQQHTPPPRAHHPVCTLALVSCKGHTVRPLPAQRGGKVFLARHRTTGGASMQAMVKRSAAPTNARTRWCRPLQSRDAG